MLHLTGFTDTPVYDGLPLYLARNMMAMMMMMMMTMKMMMMMKMIMYDIKMRAATILGWKYDEYDSMQSLPYWVEYDEDEEVFTGLGL